MRVRGADLLLLGSAARLWASSVFDGSWSVSSWVSSIAALRRRGLFLV